MTKVLILHHNGFFYIVTPNCISQGPFWTLHHISFTFFSKHFTIINSITTCYFRLLSSKHQLNSNNSTVYPALNHCTQLNSFYNNHYFVWYYFPTSHWIFLTHIIKDITTVQNTFQIYQTQVIPAHDSHVCFSCYLTNLYLYYSIHDFGRL